MVKKLELKEIVLIGKSFEEYRDSHWRLTQQILSLKAKTKEKEDERKALEKEMKEIALTDKNLWSQLEFAF